MPCHTIHTCTQKVPHSLMENADTQTYTLHFTSDKQRHQRDKPDTNLSKCECSEFEKTCGGKGKGGKAGRVGRGKERRWRGRGRSGEQGRGGHQLAACSIPQRDTVPPPVTVHTSPTD